MSYYERLVSSDNYKLVAFLMTRMMIGSVLILKHIIVIT